MHNILVNWSWNKTRSSKKLGGQVFKVAKGWEDFRNGSAGCCGSLSRLVTLLHN